ncbi:MAG: hypothetical protein WAK28_22020 [Trebonia sp.]
MTNPVIGIFATGHPVTSAGAAAISMRLVHRPSTMKATTNTMPVGAHAARTAATRKMLTYPSSIRRPGTCTAN